METTTTYFPSLDAVKQAAEVLKDVSIITPLTESLNYSKQFGCKVLLKREDLQQVRSYKIRGAYNKMSSLSTIQKENGIVCASAGNHAQGVARSCRMLQLKGTIYMPSPTPRQKIEQVKMFGEDWIDIVLFGDTFDDAYHEALNASERLNKIFIHPFNDEKVIEGQATVALEILSQYDEPIDYVIVPVGGGGLASGLSEMFKKLSPETKVIGIEPQGAPAMHDSIKADKLIRLKSIDGFVDGAAVRRVGDKTFALCRENLDSVKTVAEGKICQTILDLYNRDAIVVEPAGAMSLA
ncbi:MAG: pyridoxal-phosphate dependent enzyme, partial [Bacteroidia bacterium]|nr:pyridoxal-phosphate dependent enzyme [Bacteroidia bacterium]